MKDYLNKLILYNSASPEYSGWIIMPCLLDGYYEFAQECYKYIYLVNRGKYQEARKLAFEFLVQVRTEKEYRLSL